MGAAEMETIISKQCVAFANRSCVYIGVEIITFKYFSRVEVFFAVLTLLSG